MLLAGGSKLGPYEILAPIGAGGMGEVYKARDTRLNRTVALKVAKEQFSERFHREAEAVAALNHPHICTLHDVGPDYLVMEYVEGQPLKGPLAVERAVEYARQILDALDAAHRMGVVHRDLKPANILVTKNGVKLLDFGLAKAERAKAISASDETVTQAITQEGAILGTLQYIAPEQLQGKGADARSDLFSFGCVLYEMLTGKPAFEGENPASVIAAVLEREPAPLEVSPPLVRVVKSCLAKDPEQRFQTAREVKTALEWAMEPQAASAAKTRQRWRRIGAGEPRHNLWLKRSAWIAVVTAFAVALIFSLRRSPAPEEVVRLSINPPEGTVFTGPATQSVTAPQLALSPDGRAIVFAAAPPGTKATLWLRTLDVPAARELTGTTGAEGPFWSPDSRSIGFVAGGKLKVMPSAGGPPQVLAEVRDWRGADWGRDGHIIFGGIDTGIKEFQHREAPRLP
jgi:tRNA A-37 threonylcarbamoyl transferase component Bud32